MAVVYKHIKLSDKTLFYVGIGKALKRAYSKCDRSVHWHNIVNKHGYEVVFIEKDISWEDAKKKEIELIKEYGRICDGTGILINQTLGGDGCNGYTHTEQWKLENSIRNKGKIIPPHQIEILKKRMTNRVVTLETRKKISETLKNKPHKVRPVKSKKEDLRWINKDFINKKVDKNQIEEYIKNGWSIGRYLTSDQNIKMSKKGSSWMNNGVVEKMVSFDEINNFLKNNWSEGRIIKNAIFTS